MQALAIIWWMLQAPQAQPGAWGAACSSLQMQQQQQQQMRRGLALGSITVRQAQQQQGGLRSAWQEGLRTMAWLLLQTSLDLVSWEGN
jgi:hypothetical protein